MTRKLLVGAIAAGALAVTAGTAFALTGADDDAPTRAATGTTTSLTAPSSDDDGPTSGTSTPGTPGQPAEGMLTADEAATIVQKQYGGTVREVEHEVEHGRQEWKVEIAAADGKTYDVRVDARSGDVTRTDQDDDHDDHDDD